MSRLPLRLAFQVTSCCYAPNRGVPTVTLTLRCDPPGGSVPDPRSACLAIARDVHSFLAETPSEQCIGGEPAWGMTVTGTYQGRDVRRDYPNSTCPSQANQRQMKAWLGLLEQSPFVHLIAARNARVAPFPPPGTPHLTITVKRQHRATSIYTLGCAPPEGTHPDPVAACRAVADYLRRRKPYQHCLGVYLGPLVTVTGTYLGAQLRFDFGWLCGRTKPVQADLRVIGDYAPNEG